MGVIRIAVAQAPSIQTTPAGAFHVKINCDSSEILSEIAADAVQELVKINKAIKWYMEEFVIHLPFQEPKAQQVSKTLERYSSLLVEALHLGNLEISLQPNQSHVILHVEESTAPSQNDSLSFGSLRWEVLQNTNLWPAETAPASVTVERLMEAQVDMLPPLPSGNWPGSEGDFRILALTARPNGVDDVPHRLITKSIYDVVEKANAKMGPGNGTIGGRHKTLDIVRPGSLKALERELKRNSRYDVVHLDLHGTVEMHRAYALFDHETSTGGADPVPAEHLATLLRRHGVRTVVLNACQSAVEDEGPTANLAKTLVQYGVETVVAMAYKVLDVTARLFVSSLYDQFLRLTSSPVLAVQAARQCLLKKRTKRTRYLTEVPLDDYLVPSVYLRRGDAGYATLGLTLSDLELLREHPPELPPDSSVDIDVNLVGREGDLLKIEKQLLLDFCVMALEGSPGVGKSTLIRSVAAWWKSTGLVNRVVWVSRSDLESPKSLIELLNKEIGTELKVGDCRLNDAAKRRKRVRTKIKTALQRRKETPDFYSKMLFIFDAVEASGPCKVPELVLELMGHFLVVFEQAQLSLSQSDESVMPFESFVIVTTRRMPEVAVLNPTAPKSESAAAGQVQRQHRIRRLEPLDEDRSLLLTRHILVEANRSPDAKDWEGLLVLGQLGKLVQGNPLALRVLLSAFCLVDESLVSFTQRLLRGDSIRLDLEDLGTDLTQLALKDARRLLDSLDTSSTAIQGFYPFWAPFELKTLQDYLSYVKFDTYKSANSPPNYGLRSNQMLVEQCAGFGDLELRILHQKNSAHLLQGLDPDLAMTILQPFVDEQFATIGQLTDREVTSENTYVALHPLIPLLLRDASRGASPKYKTAREAAHSVMPRLFRYRIKSWPRQQAYWKSAWDRPREMLRWEFFDFLGAAYRALDLPSSILATTILVDLANAATKALIWDTGRRPLMATFWRTAADRMRQDRHALYAAARHPDVVPVNDWLLRLLGALTSTGTRGGGIVNFRLLTDTQTEMARLQHALALELAEMIFCLALMDYHTRHSGDAERAWLDRASEVFRRRTRLPGAAAKTTRAYGVMFSLMESAGPAQNPAENFGDAQMARKAAARKMVYKALAKTGFDTTGYDGGAWEAGDSDGDGDGDRDDNGTSRGMLGLGNAMIGPDEDVFVAVLLAKRKMKGPRPNVAEARRILYRALSNDIELGGSLVNAASVHRVLSEAVEERAARLAQKGKHPARGPASDEYETPGDYWRRALYHWEQALQVEADAGLTKKEDQVREEAKRTSMLKQFVKGQADDAPGSENQTSAEPEARAASSGSASTSPTDRPAAVQSGSSSSSDESMAGGNLFFKAALNPIRIGAILDNLPRAGSEAEATREEPKAETSDGEEPLSERRERFLLIARNGEHITPDDVAALMRQHGETLSSQETQEMFEAMDVLGKGFVNFDDFLRWELEYEKSRSMTRQEMREAFDVFDADKDGFISAADLLPAMRAVGEDITRDEAEDMIREADMDGDGRVNFDEFVLMIGG